MPDLYQRSEASGGLMAPTRESTREWDRFMISVEIGNNRKLSRLPAAQRWVYVAGVLAIAAKSPIRGALMIPPAERATIADVANQAGVTRTAARNTLERLRKLGMIESSEELGGIEVVHDWRVYNPGPPARSTEGERLRKASQRAREALVGRAA